jgi:hypothetical protein
MLLPLERRHIVPSPQYFDVLQLLHQCRDIIGEAQSRGLPTGFFRKDTARKIDALMLQDIIDRYSPASLKLSAQFRSTLDSIAPGQDFQDFSQHQIERVALALVP